MTRTEQRKALGTNAAIWSVAILASFVLPMIGDSLTENRGILRPILHVGPLLTALLTTNAFLSKSLGQPAE